MKISVIIINYKTPELTIECIRSINKFEKAVEYEIIVVDNCSKDGSLDLLNKEFPNIKIVESPKNLGFAGGNNLGVKHSAGEYLLFLNSDTYLTKPFFKDILGFYQQSQRPGVIGPRILNQDKTIQPSIFKFPTIFRAFCESFFLCSIFPRSSVFGDFRKFKYKSIKKVDFVSGACFLIARDLFNESNGFDDQYFMYAEETDLMFRLHNKGHINYFWPYGDIIHLGGASSETQGKFNTVFFESKIKYYNKHYGINGLRLFLILKIIGYFIRNLINALLFKFNKISFNNKITATYIKSLFYDRK